MPKDKRESRGDVKREKGYILKKENEFPKVGKVINSKKYKDSYYETRKVTDFKDLINSSAELFADRAAYLQKMERKGPFEPITYRRLKKEIDELGTALLSLGLKGTKIGIISETRYEWMVGYMAVANGTGIVVPLDRELPQGELENLCKRAGLSAIIHSAGHRKAAVQAAEAVESVRYLIDMDKATTAGSVDKASDAASADRTASSTLEIADNGDENSRVKVLAYKGLLEKGRKLIDSGDMGFVDAIIDPDAFGILLFTSGTMGLAKGVMLSHKNFIANIMSMSKLVKVYEGDVSLSILPLHHTYEFTCDHMTVLYQGGTIGVCQGLKYIVSNLAECKATIMLGVPLVFEMIHRRIRKTAKKAGQEEKLEKGLKLARMLKKFGLNMPASTFASVRDALGGHIRLFISGAAAMDPNIIEEFNLMGINMFQGYGMTENCPIISVHKDRYHDSFSSGPAMPGTEIRIIDKDEDGIGEIITRSDSVMLGYYENPEETAKILKDGWLYTGDYGYLDNHGNLFITGRKKNVIVTRNGKNIFPEEIEYYLNKNDFVSEVIVKGEEKEGEDITIVAHIYPDMDALKEALGELDDAQIQKLFKKIIDDTNAQMSSYKHIKRFELRDEPFEKTSTRKIKRV